MKKNRNIISYFARNLSIVIGLVLMWRGIWYVLDEIDILFADGNHAISAIGGIVLGLIILYAPDKDLNEISKL
jgi:presenilin-like A22 family membrane protease